MADTKNNSVKKTEYSIDSIVHSKENTNNHIEYKIHNKRIDNTDSIDRVDSIDDREDSIGDSDNVAATIPPQPLSPPFNEFKSL